ncbi:HNH endonuclease [Hymenobacter tenuis]
MANWTMEELAASVEAYVDLLERQNKGEKVNKAALYRSLKSRYGRDVNAQERRMQNISFVLSTMGVAWAKGLVPLENVAPYYATIRGMLEATPYIQLQLPTDDPLFLAERTAALLQEGVPENPVGIQKPRLIQSAGTVRYERSPAVRARVLELAQEHCEHCRQKAPFFTENGLPYLEVHHVRWLSQQGSDLISNTVALCPNCHRQFHYGPNREQLAVELIHQISRLVAE